MSETLRFFLVQTVFLAVVLILHTYLGLHIIRRTLIFSDLVLDQLAALGALAGIAISIEYGSAGSYLVSLGAVLGGCLMLACIKPRTPEIPREAVIGILYALALVASLLLSDKLPQGSTYVTKTLSGSLVWVSWTLVAVTVAVYAVLLLFHWVYRRTFIALAEGRCAPGTERLWDFLFFGTQGIVTVLIVPIAGVLLAYAFLMIPAGIAALFLKDWGRAPLVGWAIGFGACEAGLGASYAFNLPYSPTLILSLGVVFLGALLVRAVTTRRA
jgi:zinc/manganese transport system permease protein